MMMFAVPANNAVRENDLVDEAIAWLRKRLPAAWEIQPSGRSELLTGSTRPDAAVEIRSPGVYSTLAIEAKRSFGPRDVAGLFGSVGRTLRALNPNIPILLVAPWLSARTRELLASEGVNYLDLTGNALVQLENPALFIQSQGADRDPSPSPRSKARIRGPKAGRLIRTLADVRPPYGVRALAEATGLAPGYISRLLDALDDDALVERTKRGGVESVEVAGLLRRWAENYDVFRANDAAMFLAPQGGAQALSTLSELSETTAFAITGSFAAVRYAPVAAPALLTVYSESPSALADALKMIPADAGVNVAVLRPFDPVVWERTIETDGVPFVAPSQAVVDCLTGNGRMPSEGEALLTWMLENEPEWRLSSLADVAAPGTG